MDYFKGLRLLRDDPNRNEILLVGSVLLFSSSFIPFVGQLVLLGWQALIMRSVAMGRDGTLPKLEFDMDYLTKLMGIGFKGFIANIVWAMPAVIVMMVLMMVVSFGAAALGNDGAWIVVLLFPLVIVPFFLGLILAQTAKARAELGNEISYGFNIREVFHMTNTMFGTIFVSHLVTGMVGFALVTVGMLLCCIGMYPALVAVSVMQACIWGDIYRMYVDKGGTPVPMQLSEEEAAKPVLF